MRYCIWFIIFMNMSCVFCSQKRLNPDAVDAHAMKAREVQGSFGNNRAKEYADKFEKARLKRESSLKERRKFSSNSDKQ